MVFHGARPCVAEEILDDGVGLLLESSGDSLDDDLDMFSEFDECRKVKFAHSFLYITYFCISGFSPC